MLEHSVYCVNVGNRYSPDYVFKLKSMVERNLSIPHNFYCITDNPQNYDFSIKADEGLDSWWNKISIFKYTGKNIYFDLDVIIHNSIDNLFHKDFHMILPIWKVPWKAKIIKERPDLGTSYTNSSVMCWYNEKKIYKKFMKDPEYYMFKYRGDDRFLFHETKHKTFNEKIIYSYRDGAHWKDDNDKFKYRKEYSIALFHQEPEIHDCIEHSIVRENWKIG